MKAVSYTEEVKNKVAMAKLKQRKQVLDKIELHKLAKKLGLTYDEVRSA